MHYFLLMLSKQSCSFIMNSAGIFVNKRQIRECSIFNVSSPSAVFSIAENGKNGVLDLF
jgi:hypothetical protein